MVGFAKPGLVLVCASVKYWGMLGEPHKDISIFSLCFLSLIVLHTCVLRFGRVLEQLTHELIFLCS